jgi:imidazolonepropionase-like amidohydrolase
MENGFNNSVVIHGYRRESHVTDNRKQTLVIQNGTLIDGSGREAAANEAIVIEGNRIRSVGRLHDDVQIADTDNIEIIDTAERWVMPGLIDAHTHLSYGNPKLPGEARGKSTFRPELNTLRAAWNAQKVLRAGVTSISVPGGSWFTDVAVRDAFKLGLIERPRIACAILKNMSQPAAWPTLNDSSEVISPAI